MADFKSPAAPMGSLGPPLGPPGSSQFQGFPPGAPRPNQTPMTGFPQPMRPITSVNQQQQFRPGMSPSPGLGPSPGMGPIPGSGPTSGLVGPPRPGMSLPIQPGYTPSSQPGFAPPARPGFPMQPGGPPTPQNLGPPRPGMPPTPGSSVASTPGITPAPSPGLGQPGPRPLASTPQGMHSTPSSSLASTPQSAFGPPSSFGGMGGPPRPGMTPTSQTGMALPPRPGQPFSQPGLASQPRPGMQPSPSMGMSLTPSGPPLVNGPPSMTGPRANIVSSINSPMMPPPVMTTTTPTIGGPPRPMTYNGGSHPPMPGGPGTQMPSQPGMPPPMLSQPSMGGQSGFSGPLRPPPAGQPGPGPLINGPGSQLSGPMMNGPSSGLSGPPLASGLRPGMPPPPTSMQSSYAPQGQGFVAQSNGMAQPQNNFSGMNGPGSNMAPPPMASGEPHRANLINSRGTSLPPSRPTGMPPPIQQQAQQQGPVNGFNSRLGGLSLQSLHSGMEPVDLLQNRHILPPKPAPVPKPRLSADVWNQINCSPDIFRCTLTKIPETDSLLKKARLPLGVLIHPFKDLSHLPVIQCSTIVRCRQCRTYINPFVTFVDQRRWRCNICYRVDELPEEFLYDPVSKSYGDPSRRPECKSSTIEFIAPSEYMLRPPQPAVYVFCLDTSRQAVETGYLKVFCEVLLDELDKLPGDSRTQVAFITYDRSVHFYSMPEGSNQPTQLIVSDVDDIFLPSPSDLLVNLHENRNLIIQLLEDLPTLFSETHATDSALGAALQAAFKLASPTGGRITVFQHILPKIGPGALPNREAAIDSKSSSDTSLLGPAIDFYKKLSLDCSGQQIAVDLFAMGSQYQDLASLSGMSKFSAGQIQYFPGYHVTHNTAIAAKFENALRRYLTRKIGFEAVMRVRCTRGLTLHTFHGNFFVRSTDLLSLPNINPDAGFGIQVAIEDDLRDSREVSFQAALLYTSSKGERRIRVHTLCVPTTANLNDVINGADERAIIGMLTKFAADRAVTDSLVDAKEGLVVSCVDTIETYRSLASMSIPNGLLISHSLKLMPLYVLACLRSVGFRPGMKLDDRIHSFAQFKSLPLQQLLQSVYPDLYRVDNLSEEGALHEEGGDSSDEDGATEIIVPQPERLQLSFERISATGMYLMDLGDIFYLYLSRGLHAFVLEKCFGVTRLHDVNESLSELPELDNAESEKLRTFIQWLNGQKPFPSPIKIIREDGKSRHIFVERMIEDRMDNSFSYFEFLQHIKQQIK